MQTPTSHTPAPMDAPKAQRHLPDALFYRYGGVTVEPGKLMTMVRHLLLYGGAHSSTISC